MAEHGNNQDPPVPVVVGVGASAGGLDALERLFTHLPTDSGAAYVVIQHLSPDYKSLMEELLGKRTAMPVKRVQHGVRVLPDHVYLIPPRNNMILFRGALLLTEQEQHHGINLPIDVFLRSLAEESGEKAVGIILSGTGSDGMRGVRAIKEAGGMAMVQDEDSAQFDGMPRSAISTGLVDYVGPPESMPERLVAYLRHDRDPVREPERKLVLDEDRMVRIASLVRQRTGLDLLLYKPGTVSRRIARRLNVNQIASLDDYVHFLVENPREVTTLYREVLIGVTNFFRDPEAFEVLREQAIPDLFRTARDHKIRAWSAACSTGEEAYTLAILLDDHARRQGFDSVDVKVFATDLDREAVEFASHGLYPESIVSEVPAAYLDEYFVRRGSNYQVRRRLREQVIFAPQNLIKDPPFTKIDLLSCRNLLIYLQPPVQKRLLGLFGFALRRGGYLLLGNSENVGDFTDQFQVVDNRWRLYRKRGDGPGTFSETLHAATLHDRSRLPRPDRRDPGADAVEAVLQELFRKRLPPAVVVNDEADILHVLGDVGDFLGFRPGQPSTNLVQSVHDGLGVAVQTALHRAAKDSREVVYHGVRLAHLPEQCFTVRAQPIPRKRDRQRLFIVFFEREDSGGQNQDRGEDVDGREAELERLGDLEHELSYTRENLQATIEELETSNEELQATNEELVASNEELQSTNEELQSVNEELYTVNAEYQSKIQELTDLNADMDNLLASTAVGVLFLDENLAIRKFTPEVARHIHVLPQDVDRPLSHLASRLRDDRLLDDARGVLDHGGKIERELQNDADEWVLVKIVPYNAEAGGTHRGIVMTFIDIDRLKRVSTQLQHERDLFARMTETTPSMVMLLDPDGNITFANEQAEHYFGLTRTDILARHYDSADWDVRHRDGSPVHPEELPFRRVLDSGDTVRDICQQVRKADGSHGLITVNATPMYDDHGKLESVLAVFMDLAALTRAQEDCPDA